MNRNNQNQNNQNFDNQNYNNQNFDNSQYSNQGYDQQYQTTQYQNFDQQNYNNQPQNFNSQPNYNVPPMYMEEPKEKKKSILPVILTAIVTFVVLVVALYFGYNKFLKKKMSSIYLHTKLTLSHMELKERENLKLISKKFLWLQILMLKSLIYYQILIFLSINKAT